MSQQTEKSSYPSLYSPDKFVTPAQYIIELVCEKKAKLEKRDLPPQFWKLKEWQNFFKSQLRRCHKLLKTYDVEAVIRALRNPRAYKIRSLFAPWLEDIVLEEQRQLDVAKELAKDKQPINRNNRVSKPREHRNKDNALRRLMNIDGTND